MTRPRSERTARATAGMAATSEAPREVREEAVVEAVRSAETRVAHRGDERARTASRGVGGREATETPADDDSAPRRGRVVAIVEPAPGPAPGVLVMRSDGCVMSQQPAPDARASTSGVAVPAPGADAPQWEQRLRLPGVLQSLLEEARSERALW